MADGEVARTRPVAPAAQDLEAIDFTPIRDPARYHTVHVLHSTRGLDIDPADVVPSRHALLNAT